MSSNFLSALLSLLTKPSAIQTAPCKMPSETQIHPSLKAWNATIYWSKEYQYPTINVMSFSSLSGQVSWWSSYYQVLWKPRNSNLKSLVSNQPYAKPWKLNWPSHKVLCKPKKIKFKIPCFPLQKQTKPWNYIQTVIIISSLPYHWIYFWHAVSWIFSQILLCSTRPAGEENGRQEATEKTIEGLNLRDMSIKESIKVKLLAALSAASLLTLHIIVSFSAESEQYCLNYCVKRRDSDLKFTKFGGWDRHCWNSRI